MKRIMAIYDADPCYADKFAEYINRRDQCPFTAISFTSIDHLKSYADRQQVELLLAGSSTAAESFAAVRAARTVWLAGDGDSHEKGAVVYQYQPADVVLREVIACYQMQTGQCLDRISAAGSRMIGIYSPVNRCGKTGFGLTLGRILAKEERVLYLSLEEYSGFSRLMGREHTVGLSDFIYHFRQREEAGFSVSTFVYSLEELDYIPPVAYGEDLAQLELADLAEMLKYCAASSGYNTIIIDFARFGKGVEQLFPLCGKMYIPVLDDLVSQAKLDQWQHFLDRSGQGNLWQQMQLVNVPRQPEGAAGSWSDQLLWGETGTYIRQLLLQKEGGWEQ